VVRGADAGAGVGVADASALAGAAWVWLCGSAERRLGRGSGVGVAMDYGHGDGWREVLVGPDEYLASEAAQYADPRVIARRTRRTLDRVLASLRASAFASRGERYRERLGFGAAEAEASPSRMVQRWLL